MLLYELAPVSCREIIWKDITHNLCGNTWFGILSEITFKGKCEQVQRNTGCSPQKCVGVVTVLPFPCIVSVRKGGLWEFSSELRKIFPSFLFPDFVTVSSPPCTQSSPHLCFVHEFSLQLSQPVCEPACLVSHQISFDHISSCFVYLPAYFNLILYWYYLIMGSGFLACLLWVMYCSKRLQYNFK